MNLDQVETEASISTGNMNSTGITVEPSAPSGGKNSLSINGEDPSIMNGHENKDDSPPSPESPIDKPLPNIGSTQPDKPTENKPKLIPLKQYGKKPARNSEPVQYLYGKPLPPPVDRGNLQRQRKLPKKYVEEPTSITPPKSNKRRHRSLSTSKNGSPPKAKRGRPRKSESAVPRRHKNVATSMKLNSSQPGPSNNDLVESPKKSQSPEKPSTSSPVRGKRGRPRRHSKPSLVLNDIRDRSRKRQLQSERRRVKSYSPTQKPLKSGRYRFRGPYRTKSKAKEEPSPLKPEKSDEVQNTEADKAEVAKKEEELPEPSANESSGETKVVIPASLVIKRGRGRPRKSDYELTAQNGLVERIERPKRWSTSAVDGESNSRHSSIAGDNPTDMVAALHAGLGDEKDDCNDLDSFAQLQAREYGMDDIDKYLENSNSSTSAGGGVSLDFLNQDDLSSAFEGLERDLMVMKKESDIPVSCKSDVSTSSKESFKLSRDQLVENWERARKEKDSEELKLITVTKDLAIQCALRISEKYVPTSHFEFLKSVLGDEDEEKKESDEKLEVKAETEVEQVREKSPNVEVKVDENKDETPEKFVYKPEPNEIRAKITRVNDKYLMIDSVRYIEVDVGSYLKETDIPIEFEDDPCVENEVKPETVKEGECQLSYCRLGCICESLRYTYNNADHCRKFNCMLDCICLDGRRLTWETEHAADIRSRLRPRYSLMSWKNRLSLDTDGEQEITPNGKSNGNGGQSKGSNNSLTSEEAQLRHSARALAARKGWAVRRKAMAAGTSSAGVTALAAMLRRKKIRHNNRNVLHSKESEEMRRNVMNSHNTKSSPLKCVIRRLNGTTYDMKTPSSPIKTGRVIKRNPRVRQMPTLVPIIGTDPETLDKSENQRKFLGAKVIVRKKDGSEKVYHAPEGKRLMIRKPDGSIIVLHPDGKQVLKKTTGEVVILRHGQSSSPFMNDEPPKLEDQSKYVATYSNPRTPPERLPSHCYKPSRYNNSAQVDRNSVYRRISYSPDKKQLESDPNSLTSQSDTNVKPSTTSESELVSWETPLFNAFTNSDDGDETEIRKSLSHTPASARKEIPVVPRSCNPNQSLVESSKPTPDPSPKEMERGRSPRVVAKLTSEICSDLSLINLAEKESVILSWTKGNHHPKVARYENHESPYLYLPRLQDTDSEWLIYSLPANFSQSHFLHISQLRCFLPVSKLMSHLTVSIQKRVDVCLRIEVETNHSCNLPFEDCYVYFLKEFWDYMIVGPAPKSIKDPGRSLKASLTEVVDLEDSEDEGSSGFEVPNVFDTIKNTRTLVKAKKVKVASLNEFLTPYVYKRIMEMKKRAAEENIPMKMVCNYDLNVNTNV